jgi:branched-chain amino acid transport system permease protein
MDLAFQTAINASMTSVFYALMAVGLALVFGAMGILNFAHGEFYMIGAYVVWIVYALSGIPFPVSIFIAMAVVAGVGLIIDRGMFRHTRDRPFTGVLMSIGLVFIIQVFVAQMWGVALSRHVPPAFKGAIDIFTATAPLQRLIVIPIAITLLTGLWLFLHKSKQGQALRAAAQDREAAALQGISVNNAGAMAMGIGGMLAGAAGGLMAPIMPVTPYMGHSAVITSFIVLIVGGVGSIEGALIASFILGFLHTFVTTYVDGTMAQIAGAFLMFFVLAARPRGILGRA